MASTSFSKSRCAASNFSFGESLHDGSARASKRSRMSWTVALNFFCFALGSTTRVLPCALFLLATMVAEARLWTSGGGRTDGDARKKRRWRDSRKSDRGAARGSRARVGRGRARRSRARRRRARARLDSTRGRSRARATEGARAAGSEQ
eukprot:28703-Pelagococcus_subviridis.AAC.1